MSDWDRPASTVDPYRSATYGPAAQTPEEQRALDATSSPQFVERYGAPLIQHDGLPLSTHAVQDVIPNCYQVALDGLLFDLVPGATHIGFHDGGSLDADEWTMAMYLNDRTQAYEPLAVPLKVSGRQVMDNLQRHGGSDVDNIGTRGALLEAVVETLHVRLHAEGPAGGLASDQAMNAGYRAISNEGKNDGTLHTFSDMLFERTAQRGSKLVWEKVHPLAIPEVGRLPKDVLTARGFLNHTPRTNEAASPSPRTAELAKALSAALQKHLPVGFSTKTSIGQVLDTHAYGVTEIGGTLEHPWVRLRNPLGNPQAQREHPVLNWLLDHLAPASWKPQFIEPAQVSKSLDSLRAQGSMFFIAASPNDPSLQRLPPEQTDKCRGAIDPKVSIAECQGRAIERFETGKGRALLRELTAEFDADSLALPARAEPVTGTVRVTLQDTPKPAQP